MSDVRLLVALRWAAIAFQLCALCGAVAFHLPVNGAVLLGSILIQIAVNGVTTWGLNWGVRPSENYIFAHLLFDFAALIVFVANSGGMANPFSGLFLVQALLAALLVSRFKMWTMFGLTGIGYTVLLLAFNEGQHDHHRWMTFHMAGMVINHGLTMAVIGWIVVRIIRNLRARERQLTSRQGLVAAGAFSAQIAHNMGTPLNMIALIADDLSSDTCGRDRTAILAEVARCKTSLSHLFNRLVCIESDQVQPDLLGPSFDRLLATLSTKHPELHLQCHIPRDRAMRGASIELIRLLVEILIENASEAGAKSASIEMTCVDRVWALVVTNDGPPLAADFQELMMVGRSTKTGISHVGMGLFLARLVIESLAGVVSVESPPGVMITVRIAADVLEWDR